MTFEVRVGEFAAERITSAYGPERSATGQPSEWDFWSGPLAAALIGFRNFDLLRFDLHPEIPTGSTGLWQLQLEDATLMLLDLEHDRIQVTHEGDLNVEVTIEPKPRNRPSPPPTCGVPSTRRFGPLCCPPRRWGRRGWTSTSSATPSCTGTCLPTRSTSNSGRAGCTTSRDMWSVATLQPFAATLPSRRLATRGRRSSRPPPRPVARTTPNSCRTGCFRATPRSSDTSQFCRCRGSPPQAGCRPLQARLRAASPRRLGGVPRRCLRGEAA